MLTFMVWPQTTFIVDMSTGSAEGIVEWDVHGLLHMGDLDEGVLF